jgi:hypothetical protein
MSPLRYEADAPDVTTPQSRLDRLRRTNEMSWREFIVDVFKKTLLVVGVGAVVLLVLTRVLR